MDNNNTDNNAVLELSEVSVKKNNEFILDNISFQIEKNTTTVITGGLGSGKSTLLKLISGIMPADSGKLYINGKSYSSMSFSKIKEFRKKNGFVFQDSALWANKSLYQNLELPLQYHFPDLNKEEIKTIINRKCRALGIDINLKSRPSQISSGNRKLIAFTRALITDPDIIFIDNPLSSLDYETSSKIRDIIKKLKNDKKTLLICTYDPEITSMMADNIILLKDHTVYAIGKYNTIVKSDDENIRTILANVIDKASNFDDDILDLISPDLSQ
jgi:phospholipid/cholesterol/gamma-HCH transport system ATP-binding protein